MMWKPQDSIWRDVFDPGWRERQAILVERFLAEIPVQCKCLLGTCESRPDGCRMRQEIADVQEPAP